MTVDVVIRGVNGVFGAEFDVLYDPSVVDYTGFSDQASHLRTDGAEVTTLVSDESGRIVVGTSRVGATTGVQFVNEDLLIRLYFRRQSGAGTRSPLIFQSAFLYSAGTPPEPISGVSWFDGEFRVE